MHLKHTYITNCTIYIRINNNNYCNKKTIIVDYKPTDIIQWCKKNNDFFYTSLIADKNKSVKSIYHRERQNIEVNTQQ